MVNCVLAILPYWPAHITIEEVRHQAFTGGRIMHVETFEKVLRLLVRHYDIWVCRGFRDEKESVWLHRKYFAQVVAICDGNIKENPIRTYKGVTK
jgi:hypothetical protein